MNAMRALVLLVATALLVGAGYRWGDHARDNAWQAKDAQRVKDETSARDAEIRRGEKASGALQAELLEQRITNDTLQQAFNDYQRKHPILARRAVGQAAAAAPAAPGERPVQGEPLLDRDDPALSFGGVWMWNSALAGRNVPAGSCGLADTSEAACAADSGVTLNDAWSNHALNARLCAEDRTRYQRLIDFIQGKGQ